MSTVTHDAPASRRSSQLVPGLLFALLSASSFGLSGALAKGLLDVGWSTGAAVLARVAIAALVLVVPAVVTLRGRWWLLRRNAVMVLVFGAVSVAGCQFAYFQAVARMPVGVALLIEYIAPVAVLGYLWAAHGHRPTRLTVAGAAAAGFGLLLVVDIVGGVSVDPVGVLWALLAMTGAATYFVLGAREAQGLPPLVLAAGGMVVGSLVLAVVGAAGLIPLRVTTHSATYAGTDVPWWLAATALALITAAVPYTSGVAATRRLGSRLASFVALSEVLAGLVFAWLLLGEVPTPVQLLGGLLIVGGVVLVKLGEPGSGRS